MDEVRAQPEVYPMDFTEKPMNDFVFVERSGYDSEEKRKYWIELGIEHTERKIINS